MDKVPQLDLAEYGIDAWRCVLGALTVIIVKVDNRYVVRSQWYPFVESVSYDLCHAKLSGEHMIYLEVIKMAQQLGIIE